MFLKLGCITKYFSRYGVSAVVDGVEGPKTEFLGDKVPPKNGDNSQPILKIEQKFNSTVIFLLKTPDFNQKCEVGNIQRKVRICIFL